MSKQMRGIFAILCTPFNEDESLDEDALRREVNFVVEAGAHGIVAPVMASEFQTLSDSERKTVIRVAVEETAGRIPVVAGTHGLSAPHAVELSRYANEVGADAVIALPPYITKPSQEGVFRYYKAISDAVSIPVFVQNASPPLGMGLSGQFVVKMAREIERVEYVKEETLPTNHSISSTVAANDGSIKGVFGGAACRYMLDEMRRGADGFMPACELPDVDARIWDLYHAGKEDEARDVFEKLLPVLNLEGQLGMSLSKEVMRRRGVLKNSVVRVAEGRLDEHDMIELDRCLERLEPYFTWRP